MKILISGSAGFIGSHLAEHLEAKGHEVYGFDNFATGSQFNWSGTKRGDVAFPKRHFAFKPDLVIHCAASYKDPQNWFEDVRTNAMGTALMVQEAVAAKVPRFIYFQTALCYGKHPQTPVSLDHPLAPDCSYAISKTAGERYLQASGIDFVSFRLANIFGPRNLSGPIPTFYKRIKAGEVCTVADTRRDFIYVDDLVRVVDQAVEGVGSGVYHVATGYDYPISDLYDEVNKALGGKGVCNKVARSDDDAPTIRLDPSRTQQDFGWKSDSSLHEGVLKAVSWYEEHGVRDTFTHLKIKG